VGVDAVVDDATPLSEFPPAVQVPSADTATAVTDDPQE